MALTENGIEWFGILLEYRTKYFNWHDINHFLPTGYVYLNQRSVNTTCNDHYVGNNVFFFFVFFFSLREDTARSLRISEILANQPLNLQKKFYFQA